jgi:hypothetical protein
MADVFAANEESSGKTQHQDGAHQIWATSKWSQSRGGIDEMGFVLSDMVGHERGVQPSPLLPL